MILSYIMSSSFPADGKSQAGNDMEKSAHCCLLLHTDRSLQVVLTRHDDPDNKGPPLFSTNMGTPTLYTKAGQ